jgi:hypothetical protein
MNRTQMGMHNRSGMVTVYGTPCAIPSRNSNQLLIYSFIYGSFNNAVSKSRLYSIK